MAELFEDHQDIQERLEKSLRVVLFRLHQEYPIITEKEQIWMTNFEQMRTEFEMSRSSLNNLLVKHQAVAAMRQDDAAVFALSPSQLENINREIKHQ